MLKTLLERFSSDPWNSLRFSFPESGWYRSFACFATPLSFPESTIHWHKTTKRPARTLPHAAYRMSDKGCVDGSIVFVASRSFGSRMSNIITVLRTRSRGCCTGHPGSRADHFCGKGFVWNLIASLVRKLITDPRTGKSRGCWCFFACLFAC